uniref:Uncharacterized protein n=1 Tax=Pyxicephalus adspersus TaxID=30357 RepID=A0AAV2ZIQ6_PYXAD|nr:TPA: hypothetical protein GDO54_002881 [Pyxicephalus adspersus]
MAKSGQNYFPSIHDCSPLSQENIWKQIQTSTDAPEVLPKAKNETETTPDWPGGLGYLRYKPLWVFCPPEMDFHLPPSPWDELCEQGIKSKEKELMAIIEEETET